MAGWGVKDQSDVSVLRPLSANRAFCATGNFKEDIMTTSDRLTTSLNDIAEVEAFLHAFIPALVKRRPKAGEDVTRHAEEFDLKLPDALKGAPILWVGHERDDGAAAKGQIVTLARPGNADALGFTVGCITFRGRRWCLECGWLYCRITTRI